MAATYLDALCTTWATTQRQVRPPQSHGNPNTHDALVRKPIVRESHGIHELVGLEALQRVLGVLQLHRVLHHLRTVQRRHVTEVAVRKPPVVGPNQHEASTTRRRIEWALRNEVTAVRSPHRPTLHPQAVA